jgi:hypothetical protein
MFCPSCGAEYTKKMNYCKRCGGWLMNNTVGADAPKLPRISLAGIFWAISGFSLFGLITLALLYRTLWISGARDTSLSHPFLIMAVLIGVVAGLMIKQLSRLITANLNSIQGIGPERPEMRKSTASQSAQSAAPSDSVAGALPAVDSPSVVEHTTRQMAHAYKEPTAGE